MADAGFAEFEAAARADGFDEVLQKQWEPGRTLGTHAHAFDARLRVMSGEMWLTHGSDERHLRPGDGCELAAGVLHEERYGPDGALLWIARRRTHAG
jgi:quercetin dioxygenase-like cupin family protein